MSVFDRLRDKARRTAGSVLKLPVISDKVVEDPRLERIAADQGLVPRRCGLCKHFSKSELHRAVSINPAFREATHHLPPENMGTASRRKIDEATLALRPELTDRWEDYGACRKYQIGIWAFEVAPAMPETKDPPCEEWL